MIGSTFKENTEIDFQCICKVISSLMCDFSKVNYLSYLNRFIVTIKNKLNYDHAVYMNGVCVCVWFIYELNYPLLVLIRSVNLPFFKL